MWKLISERNPDVVYCLLVGKEYSIGRRDCEILIPDDMSISRKHAVIKVFHPESNLAFPDKKSVLLFKDLSKLGTQLSDGRIANGQERNLKDGDRMIFGTAGISRYRVNYFPIVFTTSCLAPASKKDVKRNVLRLGGHLVNEWCTECEGVVMNNLSVTIKVISALLSLKPVFTPQYLEDLIKAAETSTKLPIVGDYLPALSESQVSSSDVSFGADARRRTLFQEKTFVFLSPSQYKKLHASLELGGAKTKMITSAEEIESLVSGKDCCVMAPDASGSQIADSWMQSVQSVLNRTKRRMIAESEIGFSVLYCSTNIHCNSSAELNVPHGALAPMSLSQNIAQLNSQILQPPERSQPAADRNIGTLTAGSSYSVGTPVPPVKIKEEVLSQSETPSIRNKKRGREESVDQNPDGSKIFNPQDDVKKCRLETRTNDSKSAAVSSVIASNTANPRTIEISQNERINAANQVKTTEALHSSFSLRSEFSAAKELKDSHCAVDGPESLEMDFSIGTCIEPSGNIIKMEATDAPIKNCLDTENKNVERTIIHDVQVKNQHEKLENDYKLPLPVTPLGPSKENIHVQPGYLTTLLPIKMNIDPDFENSSELPSKLVVTEVKNLVFRKPGQRRLEVTASNDLVIWNGKPVKNFKKFRKVKGLVSSGLPRLIGGSALVAHKSVPTAEQEDWFRNEREAESQRAYSELLSQELASWQPTSRRR